MVTSLALELCMTMPRQDPQSAHPAPPLRSMTPIGVADRHGRHFNVHTCRPCSCWWAAPSGCCACLAVPGGRVCAMLYVTFFEILSEELGHHSNVLKVTVTVVGFAAIAVAKIWDTD
ncbi:hypothetical protein ACOMHN_060858 [Nucella lapillus]